MLQKNRKGIFEKDWYCIDTGSTLKWVACLKGKSQCLTRSRACGHYLPRFRRFLTMADHGALQGLTSSVTVHMKEACNGDKQAVRAALGDALSLHVLMSVLGNIYSVQAW